MRIPRHAIKYIKRETVKRRIQLLYPPFVWWNPHDPDENTRGYGNLFIETFFYEEPTEEDYGSREVERVVEKEPGLDVIETESVKRGYPWVRVTHYFEGIQKENWGLERIEGQEWSIANDPAEVKLWYREGGVDLEPNEFYMLADGRKLDKEKLRKAHS